MRKFLSLLFCVLLLCTVFSGCGEADSGKVVVCFDIGNTDKTGYHLTVIDTFLGWLDNYRQFHGLSISSEDVEVVVIPGSETELAERSAMMQRIRAEIMAGKGPDVFICSTFSNSRAAGEELTPMESGRLFPYVENTRESGIFLPLDGLLSDLTLTDAEDLIPQVLAGGKNQNGEQVILPLTFSVPGTAFSGEDTPDCDFEGSSWSDVLQGDDPVLREQADWFLHYYSFNGERVRVGDHASGLFCLYPRTADFENGELYFSEEELLAMVRDSLRGYRETVDFEMTRPCASLYFNPMSISKSVGDNAFFPEADRSDSAGPAEMIPAGLTFVPLRNLEGGSTAVVNAYCAVNSNTKQKEKALAVIDLLLCRDFQKGSNHDTADLFFHLGGMPIDRNLATGEHPYLTDMALSPEQYENWQRVCADINVVRFPSALDAELDAMMAEIQEVMLKAHDPDGKLYASEQWQFIYGSIGDGELAEIVSRSYQRMQRLLDES